MSTNELSYEKWQPTDIPTAEKFNAANGKIYDELNKSNQKTLSLQGQIDEMLRVGILDKFYPIGSVFTTTNASFNTADKVNAHFGGKWESFGGGRVIVGAGGSYAVSAMGGAESTVLQVSNMPSHSHAVSIAKHNHKLVLYAHSHPVTNAKHSHHVNQDTHRHNFSFRLRRTPGQQSEWHPQAANGNWNNGESSPNYETTDVTTRISLNEALAAINTENADVFGEVNDANVSATIGSIGGGAAINNMQPYVVCYVWRRKE